MFFFFIAESTEQMLAAYMCEVQNYTPETVDKETNTECAFLPEKQRNRFTSASSAVSASNVAAEKLLSGDNVIDERVVKRSQTFSPSAVVSKNRYICRLNRSDSDSAMHHFGGLSVQHSFQRGAAERRSLRFHSKVPKNVPPSKYTYSITNNSGRDRAYNKISTCTMPMRHGLFLG